MTIKQLKQIVFTTIALFPFLAIAQNQTTSPYSFFGLGETYQQGNIRTLSMGGTNLAVRSNLYINFDNPASYTGIDSLSFVTSIGLQSTMGSYRTNEQSSNFSNTTVNHLSFAFPISHWWKTSIALIPFSNIGYEVQQDKILDFNVSGRSFYTGSGGLDRLNWGNAFQITKHLSVGVNTSYYFGRIQHQETVLFPDSVYILNSRLRERSLLSGFHFSVGAQYFVPTGNNSALGLAFTYTPTANLDVKTDYLATTFTGDQNGLESAVDTVYNWNASDGIAKLPYGYGFGISWEKKNKLLIAADLMFDQWSSFTYLDQSNTLDDKLKASVGIEFIPTSNNLSSYLKLIHYRMGFRYNKLGLKFNNNILQEYAISLGFGLPLRKSKSILNLGMEVGQNGTIENSLIQERFFKLTLGISIRESWFRKGKYF